MPDTAVKLRPYHPADLGFILSLEADEAIGPFIRPWSRQAHIDAQNDRYLLYRVAEVGSREVGFVILRIAPDKVDTIEFVRLAIDERRKGYGRATIEAVKSMALHDLGLSSIWLEVFPENSVAQNLYNSLNFESVDQRFTENGFAGKPGQVIRMEHNFE